MKKPHAKTMFLAAAVAACAAAPAFGANAEMSLAYHGKLVAVGDAKINTKIPMTVEFRLFRNAEPGETAPLWGRLAPVRFDADGSFYTELSDSAGAASQNALHESLADAIAAASGEDVWLSVKPAEYGELLPRKRLGGVHRAERATTAASAGRVEAKTIEAETINAGVCEISGSLTVGKTVFSGGGTVNNTIDGSSSNVSIGSPKGTVLVTSTFDNWYDFSQSYYNYSVPKFGPDMLIGFKCDQYFGAFSLPVQGGTPGSGIEVKNKVFLIQYFLNGYYDPFF